MACPPWFCPCLASHVHNSDLLQGLLPHVIFQYISIYFIACDQCDNDSEASFVQKKMRSCALQALRLSAGNSGVLKFSASQRRETETAVRNLDKGRPRGGSFECFATGVCSAGSWLRFALQRFFCFQITLNYIKLLFTQMIIDDHR